MGAEPCPASLENNPRLIPQTNVVKNTPDPTPNIPASGVKA